MDIYKLRFTKLQNEIIRLLCIKAGETLNQRQIAKLLRVSPTAVAKSLPDLEKMGLIKFEKSMTMNLSSIQLNRDNPYAIALKRTENLKLVQDSGLADYLEEKFPGCPAILFGSYSLGEDTFSSDIDIAILDTKKKDLNLSSFDKILERAISLHFFGSLRKISGNLRANVINGITLHGFVEL